MVLIWFLCLCTWKNRLLCLRLYYFYKTKVEMLKFAALMAKYLTNNLWKFHQKILNYSENNEIFVGGGCFLAAPGISSGECRTRHSTVVFSTACVRVVAHYTGRSFTVIGWRRRGQSCHVMSMTSWSAGSIAAGLCHHRIVMLSVTECGEWCSRASTSLTFYTAWA